jgi:hypothetical protein
MFYTLITLLVYLLLGAPHIDLSFNPVFAAFVLAIIVDLFINRGLFIFNKPNQP